jgi:pheromone shutdown protein TraB
MFQKISNFLTLIFSPPAVASKDEMAQMSASQKRDQMLKQVFLLLSFWLVGCTLLLYMAFLSGREWGAWLLIAFFAVQAVFSVIKLLMARHRIE